LAILSAASLVGFFLTNDAIAHHEGEKELPGHDAPSSIVIAPDSEPGQRLIVTGRVYAPDGKTPVAGVTLYVYHTDVEGSYGPARTRTPRLRGWLRTDANGCYEYRTIRPSPYPGRDIPAHIHVFMWGAGFEPQWTESLLFSDDPFLPNKDIDQSRDLGRFGFICSPRRIADGALKCNVDYRLKTKGDRFSDEVHHAFEAS